MSQPIYECHGTDKRRKVSMTIFSIVCVVLAVMGIIIFFTGFTSWGAPDVIMLAIILILLVYGVFGFSIVATSGKSYVKIYYDHVEARGYGLNFHSGNGIIGGKELSLRYTEMEDVTVKKNMVSLIVDGKISRIPCSDDDSARKVAMEIGRRLNPRRK